MLRKMRNFPATSVLIGLLAVATAIAQAPVAKTIKDVSVSDFKIRVADEVQASDWSQDFQQVAFNSKASKLVANDDQKLQLSFAVVDAAKAAQVPHQVFVRLASASKEVILIPAAQSPYTLDLDIKAKAKLFDNESGKYEMSLIIGDSKMKPVQWVFGEVELQFSNSPVVADDFYAKKPEIVHKFREPEKRPAEFVSNVFGLAIMALFVVMLLLWAQIGVSIANVNLSSLLFQGSLAAILYIEYLFYLGNDMFTTLRYLTWTAPLALYFGKRMLSNLAKIDEQ